MERREFLRKGFRDYLVDLKVSFNPLNILEEEDTSIQSDYFESFDSCYPLLSEAPYEMLVEAALKLGISVENKTKLEIAKEVFGKEGGKCVK